MSHGNLTVSGLIRRRLPVRVVIVCVPMLTLIGCTMLPTRQEQYRERRVALQPLPLERSNAVASVEVPATDEP